MIQNSQRSVDWSDISFPEGNIILPLSTKINQSNYTVRKEKNEVVIQSASDIKISNLVLLRGFGAVP